MPHPALYSYKLSRAEEAENLQWEVSLVTEHILASAGKKSARPSYAFAVKYSHSLTVLLTQAKSPPLKNLCFRSRLCLFLTILLYFYRKDCKCYKNELVMLWISCLASI